MSWWANAPRWAKGSGAPGTGRGGGGQGGHLARRALARRTAVREATGHRSEPEPGKFGRTARCGGRASRPWTGGTVSGHPGKDMLGTVEGGREDEADAGGGRKRPQTPEPEHADQPGRMSGG